MTTGGAQHSHDDAASRAACHGFRHLAMACDWEIRVVAPDAAYAQQAAAAAFGEIDRLEQELSRFVPHSDISRINALSAGRSVRIGPDAFDCLRIARRMHALTGGAFDVTIGALLGRRADDRPQAAPAPAAPGQTLASQPQTPPHGLERLHFDDARKTVTAAVDGLIVDLGGLGKGYAIERAVELLREWGVTAGLVHSGQSTVYALGAPAGQPGWKLAIRAPARPAETIGYVTLRDQALSGSGAELHGPHIIDPRTGQAAQRARAAWACAPSAAVADALSTAFMTLEAREIREVCERAPEVAALVLLDSGPVAAGAAVFRGVGA